jgi:hypothetical protein
MIKPRILTEAGHVAYRVFVSNLKGQLGRPTDRWDDNIVTCMSDCRRGIGLDIGFIVYLYTRLETRSNYGATVNLHNS